MSDAQDYTYKLANDIYNSFDNDINSSDVRDAIETCVKGAQEYIAEQAGALFGEQVKQAILAMDVMNNLPEYEVGEGMICEEEDETEEWNHQ